MTYEQGNRPEIFDHQLRQLRRKRHRSDAFFLHQLARDEIQDRLSMVNRTFTNPLIITPFAEVWQGALSDAILIEDNELIAGSKGGHDLVIHAMALHSANDPVGQLIQCRHNLQEDGLMLAVSLGGKTLHELRSSLAEAETYITGGLSPRVAPMGEVRDLGALLQRAGFNLPVADVVPVNAEYRDLTHLMHDLRAMGETNIMTDRLKTPTRRAVFELAEHIYRQNFTTASGRLAATFELICLTGWSPSDNQPRPLRPGSAKARLADALKVPEKKLPKG